MGVYILGIIEAFLFLFLCFALVFGIVSIADILTKHYKKKKPVEKKTTVKIINGSATYDPAFNHFIEITTRNPIHFGTEKVLVVREDLQKILDELEKEP